MSDWIKGILFFFMTSTAWASLPALVLLDANKTTSTAKNAEYLEDPSGRLNFEEVRQLGDEKFIPQSTLKTLNEGSAYWVRVKLKHGLADDAVFVVTGYWWDYIDAYVVRTGGKIETLRQTGLRGKSASESAGFYAAFTLHRDEEVALYARLESTGQFRKPTDANILLRPKLASLERGEFWLYMDGIVFGILFGLAVYSGMLAISTRDKSYYWYCTYLLFISISFMGLMGMHAPKITQFFFPESPLIGIWLKRMSDPVSWISIIMFTRLFLGTRLALRWCDQLLIALMVILVLQFAYDAIVGIVGYTPLLLYVLINLTCLVAGFIRWRQGLNSARFFIAAQFILVVAVFLDFALRQGWPVLDFMPASGVAGYVRSRIAFVGFALEAMFFSLALAQRMRALQDEVSRSALAFEIERKRVAEEQKVHLELEVAARTNELSQEKEKSDRLLYNILPAVAADELKATGASQPRRYEEATILFTDFKGFTDIVATLPPRKVIEELNDIFHHFDDIIVSCGIEKIKTIGDSYMIAGGLPNEQQDHAERCVEAALKMLSYLEERNKTSSLKWLMRAGLHSGAVVAGVVGKNKFTYDVWGDTVNIASRLESASEPGRINISAYTYELVKHRYRGEYRGKLEAKGKGEIDMYFVVGGGNP